MLSTLQAEIEGVIKWGLERSLKVNKRGGYNKRGDLKISMVNVYGVDCRRWGWREGQHVCWITGLFGLKNALLLFLHIF